MRSRSLLLLVLLACARAPVRPDTSAEELRTLREQVQAQGVAVAQQQRRIEELEIRLAAALAPRAQPAAVPAASEQRPALQTVKLPEPRRAGRAGVLRAPPLPANVELREPDEERLARLDEAPAAAPRKPGAIDADFAWAQAVDKLNAGRHDEAEAEFLAFVAAHPQHTAADNALYLAGLIRETRGDCAQAITLFEQVPARYPAGDAVPQSELERARCLASMGKRNEAKKILSMLEKDHAGTPEARAAEQLLLTL